MNRRQFLYTSAAGLALSAAGYADDKPRRVGIIGPGWYGKADLFRLIQVAPVEVVSLCDVDKQMLARAADLTATRQASGKRPRTYADYREMLKEKDLDIVLVATPDHWHALAMIAALSRRAPTSTCRNPSAWIFAKARPCWPPRAGIKRVVQVGTQRRSTPHIIEARDRFIKAGKLGNIGLVEMCCYYHMRATGNPPDTDPPPNLDYEMWTGPAPMRPYNSLVHPRGWRAFMEYGNGIVGDMCIHMFDMVRWMLGLGWPKRVSSEGGILIDKQSKANISDTQTATFDYDNLKLVWQHRTWGSAPDPDPNYAWSCDFLWRQRHAEGERLQL